LGYRCGKSGGLDGAGELAHVGGRLPPSGAVRSYRRVDHFIRQRSSYWLRLGKGGFKRGHGVGGSRRQSRPAIGAAFAELTPPNARQRHAEYLFVHVLFL
jgi:hypothetical protein